MVDKGREDRRENRGVNMEKGCEESEAGGVEDEGGKKTRVKIKFIFSTKSAALGLFLHSCVHRVMSPFGGVLPTVPWGTWAAAGTSHTNTEAQPLSLESSSIKKSRHTHPDP